MSILEQKIHNKISNPDKAWRDFWRSIMLLAGITLPLFVIALTVGQLLVESDLELGLYQPSWRGLDAYYNPFWNTILFAQFWGAVVLILGLITFRKKLHLPVLPWVLTVCLAVVATYKLIFVFPNLYPFDDSVSSVFPWFLAVELIIILAIFLGHGTLYLLDHMTMRK